MRISGEKSDSFVCLAIMKNGIVQYDAQNKGWSTEKHREGHRTHPPTPAAVAVAVAVAAAAAAAAATAAAAAAAPGGDSEWIPNLCELRT